jgi:hypothetical protein
VPAAEKAAKRRVRATASGSNVLLGWVKNTLHYLLGKFYANEESSRV